jgi:hypothetical protein
MIDRTTKIMLAAIALGLSANAAKPFFSPALADDSALISDIAHDLHAIYNGTCNNEKIC